MCSSGLILNPYIYTSFPACLVTVLTRVFVQLNNMFYVPVTVHREQSVKKEYQQDATI